MTPIILFVILTEIFGAVTGFLFSPGAWYSALEKPFFHPPDWIFGVVWPTLFVLIGVAGGLVWRLNPQSDAMKLWYFQLFLNGFWSFAFFYLQSPVVALVVLALLVACIGGFIAMTWRQVPIAAKLFIPYLLWVLFAGVLNTAIIFLN